MRHKKYNLRQRVVMAIRQVNAQINALAECAMQCPGCGSSNVTGDGRSWICHNCGSQGQS